jgi:hypothetical protein
MLGLLKNKIVRLAALALASFAVINVGMFFFLKMTQPKMGARAETASKVEKTLLADSTAHAVTPVASEPFHDSTAAVASKDTSGMQPLAEAPKEQPPQQPIAEASLATPSTPAMPPAPEPETSVSTVDSTPVATVPDSAATQAAATPVIQTDSKELGKLAKLLESVKPDEAAAIASQLDIEQIVALVMKMKDRSAGQMLAAMPAEQAAKVALRMSQVAAQTRGKS